jgi:hypothetical protein
VSRHSQGICSSCAPSQPTAAVNCQEGPLSGGCCPLKASCPKGHCHHVIWTANIHLAAWVCCQPARPLQGGYRPFRLPTAAFRCAGHKHTHTVVINACAGVGIYCVQGWLPGARARAELRGNCCREYCPSSAASQVSCWMFWLLLCSCCIMRVVELLLVELTPFCCSSAGLTQEGGGMHTAVNLSRRESTLIHQLVTG